jgi:phospholipase D1/2
MNVRNYDKTTRDVVAEVVYVHSKLMIVDDAVAMIGSVKMSGKVRQLKHGRG